MGIPLVALGIRPLEQPDILGQYAKLSALRGQQQAQQIQAQQAPLIQRQLELQNLEQEQRYKDAQAQAAAMQEWDGKDINQLPGLVQKHGGSAQTVMGMKAGILKQNQDLQTFDKGQLENEAFKNNLLLGHLDAVKSLPDQSLGPALTQILPGLVQSKLIDPQHASGIAQLAQQDPATIRQSLDIFEKGLTGHKEQLEQASKAQADAIARADEARKAAIAPSQLATSEADAKLKQEQAAMGGTSPEMIGMKDWLAKHPNKGPSDYQIAMKQVVPAFNFNLQSGLLNDSAKDMAAENYYQTGQLPAGARSPAIISSIINRAAELHPGGNLAGNRAAFDANKQSLENVTKTLDSLEAFSSAANKNLDQFLKLTDKLPDTGVPWLNTPVRMLNEKMVGNEWMPAINTAREVANREIARVTNDPKLSGALSDSARREVQEFNPKDATVGQIRHVVQVLRQDMQNVHEGLTSQKSDIQGRIGSQSASSAQSPQMGTIKTFPNGNKGKWDGNGWVLVK